MSKLFSAILYSLIVLPLFGERITKTVELYEAPGRQAIAQLYTGTTFYIEKEVEGWAKIITVVHTSTENLDDYTLEIQRKAELKNRAESNTLQGKVYNKLKLQGLYNITTDDLVFELIGYIRKSEIDTNWIPELKLTRIIDSTESKVAYDDVLSQIEKHGFFVTTKDSGFIAFQLNDVKGLDYKNPIERLKLIFYENRLVAIFHKNPFPLNTKEVIQIGGQKNLIYLRDLSADEKRIFGELFLD